MAAFHEIIGHEDIIRHLKTAKKTGKISHAYLFTGSPGSGKKLMAGTFAAALQCEKDDSWACRECDSCRKAAAKNHPDIITLTHEKANLISVEEVRDQVIHDVAIRPYASPYKIYIIPDADLMNPSAQNAILKTIEEPPEYAVILLLTTSAQSLLPTILSRCVRLDLKVVGDRQIRRYLMEQLHVADYQADLDVSVAQGSIGRAEKAASQEFWDMAEKALNLLKRSRSMEVYELTEAIRDIAQDKQKVDEYLDLFLFWFRDILMYKATDKQEFLVFKQEINAIRDESDGRSYENLEKVLNAIDKARARLHANVNVELALELLFMTIREV